jgi:amino acid adenylation domain-containing protein
MMDTQTTEMRTETADLSPRTARGYRLSPQQNRLWSLEQAAGGAHYRVQCVLLMRGPLDDTALNAAVGEVASRHTILRTSFRHVREAGLPLQIVKDEAGNAVRWDDAEDLSGLDAEARHDALRRLLCEFGRRPFDADGGECLRLKLIKSSPSEHRLFVALPALCSDAAGLKLLAREVAEAYAARPRRPADEPMQYAAVSQWLNELLESEEIQAGKSFWRGLSASKLDSLKLPFERGLDADGPFDARVRRAHVGRETAALLAPLAAKHGASPSDFLLACWQVLLWRHSDRTELVVGAEFDGRTESDLEQVLGALSKYLPLQLSVEPGRPFRELLSKTARAVGEAASWQEAFTWDSLAEQEASAGPFGAAYCFAYGEQWEEQEARGVVFSVEEQFECVDRYKLKLVCRPSGDALLAEFHYDGRHFDDAAIEHLMRQFETLLGDAARNAEKPLDKLELLAEKEAEQLLVGWNDTAGEYERETPVHRLFERQALLTPRATALVCGDASLTYQELDARSNQLGHYLRRMGVGPEVRVGVCLPRSAELVVALLGVMKAGGCYVPLDSSYPIERLAMMLEDAQTPVLVTDEEGLDSLPSQWGQVVCMDTDRESVEQESEESLEGDEVSADGAAYVIYTSGSTGRPKGVVVPHRGITRLVRNTNYARFEADEVFLQLAPVSFDASTFELWGSLLNGGRLVVMPAGRPSPAELGDAIVRHGVTTMWLTAGLFHVMVHEQLPALANLRRLLAGGDVLGVREVRRFLSATGGRVTLVNGYGPTESTTFACCHSMRGEQQFERSVPVGRPISNTRVYVLDAEMRPVPVGTSGELYIGGDGLARGYLNRPELTAERFVPHPFSRTGGERLYRTGDVVRHLSDGNIEFIGRTDHQVKVRGFRVEPGEIEAALQGHAGVRECVIVALASDGGDKRLVAYVVAEDEGDGVSAAELRAHLKERLPEYMMPSHFVLMDEMPLTPNGKVDRRALPEPSAVVGNASEYVGTRTPVEELLAGIWSQVLGVERVGTGDNFFELGGHSLLATQLVSRIREAFGVDVPLRAVFESPTMAELAAEVEREMRAGYAAPTAIGHVSREGRLPLSFAQERLWFLDQLEPDSALYNILAALRLEGRLDVSALEQTLTEVVRRHETLRTTFSVVDGQPVQTVGPAEPLRVPVVELFEATESEREAAVRRLATAEARRPFDLSKDVMLRATLLKLADDDHVLLFTMHHIASDGWSIGVLVREVVRLYAAFVKQEPHALPEPRVQYADFAHWQRDWLRGEALEGQLAYWTKQLAGAPSVIELPTDRPRPPVQTFRGATHTWSVPKSLTDSLKALSREEGVTLYMTLLATYAALLSRYSRQQDVTIGTPIANRNRAETEDLIGFFVNTLALRIDLAGDPTFRQLLRRVGEVSLEGYLHQDLPFEKLVEELQPERSLSYHPLFQVMFIFNNAPMPELQLPGLSMRGVEFASGVAKFDTTLIMMETDEGLKGFWEYNLDLFDASTAERMVGHFNALLESAAADADRRVAEVSLLDEAEERTLLEDWNDTAADYPRDLCVHQLFAEQARLNPDATAASFAGESITYGELNGRANRLAHHLRSLGVGPEVMVGVLLERSIDWMVALLGVLKAGGAYVSLDPRYPAERLAFMVEDARAPVLLTQARLVGEGVESEVEVVRLDEDWDAVAAHGAHDPENLATHENAAYVVYTSGSTGRPKGVVTSHGSMLNLVFWHRREFAVGESDRASQVARMGFDASVWEIWPYLTAGASVHLIDEETRLSPPRVKDWLVENRITIGWLPPALAEGVLASEGLEQLHVRKLMTGSDRVVLRPPQSLRCDFVNAYGPTEATVIVTAGIISGEAEAGGAPHIGRPLANTQVYILDSRMRPVPVGVAGELCIGGDNLARGYLHRPALTAEKFVPSPFGARPGARLYRTGDLARFLHDGNIEFIGRIDHQVKIRGFRIEIGEVEATLLRHPAVEAAAVVVYEATPGDKRLAAYVVNAAGQESSAGGELRDFLRGQLPEYMVPSSFVMMDAMPLSPNGKVDRKALPAPEQAGVEAAADYVAPATPLEEELAAMWSDILGVERVGARHNFFELGGHSLLATQLISHVRERFDVELPLRDFFESPTVAELAVTVELARAEPRGQESPRIRMLPRGEQSIDELLAELDGLSDEEAGTILAGESAYGD